MFYSVLDGAKSGQLNTALVENVDNASVLVPPFQ
jgi:hypothetical protein